MIEWSQQAGLTDAADLPELVPAIGVGGVAGSMDSHRGGMLSPAEGAARRRVSGGFTFGPKVQKNLRGAFAKYDGGSRNFAMVRCPPQADGTAPGQVQQTPPSLAIFDLVGFGTTKITCSCKKRVCVHRWYTPPGKQ